MTLPGPYLDYLCSDAPKEGALTVEPGWFQLWQPAEIEQLNRDYHVSEFAPGFLGFGSSGGGELLAFDSFDRIFMLPMVGMSPEEARPVASCWSEFVERVER
jgi:hypothetical protein